MFTAQLQRQYRDIHTSSPKVLLTNIQHASGEFRDHCWVSITSALQNLVPSRCGQKKSIQFTADVLPYYKGSDKFTLRIKDVRLLR